MGGAGGSECPRTSWAYINPGDEPDAFYGIKKAFFVLEIFLFEVLKI